MTTNRKNVLTAPVYAVLRVVILLKKMTTKWVQKWGRAQTLCLCGSTRIAGFTKWLHKWLHNRILYNVIS